MGFSVLCLFLLQDLNNYWWVYPNIFTRQSLKCKTGNYKKKLLLLTIIFISVTVIVQTKKIQLFTGAMTIENGIRYDGLKKKVNDDLLRTVDIPLMKSFQIN